MENKSQDVQKAAMLALELVRKLAQLQIDQINEVASEESLIGLITSMVAPEMREEAETVIRWCERMQRSGRQYVAEWNSL